MKYEINVPVSTPLNSFQAGHQHILVFPRFSIQKYFYDLYIFEEGGKLKCVSEQTLLIRQLEIDFHE